MNTRPVDIANTSSPDCYYIRHNRQHGSRTWRSSTANITHRSGHKAERALLCHSSQQYTSLTLLALMVTLSLRSSACTIPTTISHQLPYKFLICTILTTRPAYSNDLHFPILTTQGDAAYNHRISTEHGMTSRNIPPPYGK